jgi:hypothetical protein
VHRSYASGRSVSLRVEVSPREVVVKDLAAAARKRVFPENQAALTLGRGKSKRRVARAGASTSRSKSGGEKANLARALAEAHQRGETRVAEILAGPDMLNVEDFARLLGTSRVTVNAKRQAGQVLGLEGTTRGFRFPAWQLDREGRPFSALPRIFEILGPSPWAVYRFLVQHHAELGGHTAIEALRKGRSDNVIDAAKSAAAGFG